VRNSAVRIACQFPAASDRLPEGAIPDHGAGSRRSLRAIGKFSTQAAPFPIINTDFDMLVEKMAPNSSEAVEPNRVEIQAGLEAMPHLLSKIQQLWKTRELNTFITGLFMDTRDGSRAGFPKEVVVELAFLSELNLLLRAAEAAPLLRLSLPETIELLGRGDLVAMGHLSPSSDVWGANVSHKRNDLPHRKNSGS
jgi:hypothetical protein